MPHTCNMYLMVDVEIFLLKNCIPFCKDVSRASIQKQKQHASVFAFILNLKKRKITYLLNIEGSCNETYNNKP